MNCVSISKVDGSISRREHAIVSNTVAWRQHRLIFDDASIDEMAEEFNRYNHSVRLRLEGLAGDKRRSQRAGQMIDDVTRIVLGAMDER